MARARILAKQILLNRCNVNFAAIFFKTQVTTKPTKISKEVTLIVWRVLAETHPLNRAGCKGKPLKRTMAIILFFQPIR